MAEPISSSTSGTTRSTSPDQTRPTSSDQRNQPSSGIASARGSGQQNGGEQGGGIVDRMKQGATAQLTSQKDRGVDAIGSVAQAVRSSTQKLREEKHETIASYVDKAADQIDSWSRRLREKDVDELVTDIQQLARRQPAVFIGSAFALGLVGARFLKSSRSDDEYAYGGDARRWQQGGSSRMSTGYGRGGADYTGAGGGVALVADEVVISDVVTGESDAGSSLGDNTGARSTRNRKSSSRTERS